ncbi:MAG: dCTP deaminase [Acetobacteraceae bacterium]
MIWTDREIKLALDKGALVIKPRPVESAFSSTSVDLTLDPIISEFKDRATDRYFDPGKPGYSLETILGEETEQVTISPDDSHRYELTPGKLILAWTAEYLDLRPSPSLAARVEGKSSLGRLGLGVHVTAPTIHAGFVGRIRLEMVNHGHIPIRLRPGMKICQLIFEQAFGTPEKLYGGIFLNQSTSDTV